MREVEITEVYAGSKNFIQVRKDNVHDLVYIHCVFSNTFRARAKPLLGICKHLLDKLSSRAMLLGISSIVIKGVSEVEKCPPLYIQPDATSSLWSFIYLIRFTLPIPDDADGVDPFPKVFKQVELELKMPPRYGCAYKAAAARTRAMPA